MNSFYTLEHKTMQCPLWLTKVTITGKYRLRDDGTAYLVATECGIVKNLRLPKKKQNKELALFRYCRIDDCPCLKAFDNELKSL